ncbi:hypothetical protein HOM13_00385 [Candidatus Woesearchaeota archaeon]|jgi:hypothetical protein|nr:hypothetical protein [Candidatus Woesearchaeota archaeon]MBT5215176.1 hypothetical protein [Candidatus Woesearchaeota archaeon]MBT6402529.1 hypothetical protein [Candidatus Woesearchaeota archaeon]
MNKKGLAYVDWIISLSLFLVTVLMIFAFLRPGIVPSFESKDLINIVENNFLEENSWEMISIPIAIQNIENNSYSIDISHSGLSEWRFIGYRSNQDLGSLDISITNTSSLIIISCISGSNCNTNISAGSTSTSGIYLVSIEKDWVSSNKIFEMEDTCSSTDMCTYSLGSKELFNGLSMIRINHLINEDITYSEKKEDWSFPDSRDFSIHLDYLNGTLVKITSPEFEPSDQSSVFVKEISMPILNEDGKRSPTKVNIRVW